MTGILGLIMLYAWVHATIIIFKKVERTTKYEKVVLWVGLIAFTLTEIGIMFG